MKTRLSWRFWLLLIFIGVLTGRVVWTVAFSPLGWQPHLEDWGRMAGWLSGWEQVPLASQDPPDQARFWLREIDRVPAVHTDPQMALGAAWVLDSPQRGYLSRHFIRDRSLDYAGMPLQWQLKLDHQTIQRLNDEFETLCRDECLAHIERALELDSTDVEFWRAKALLMFKDSDLKPRRADVLSLLDECARHDPDNSLYDYLAALTCWAAAGKYDWQQNKQVVQIDDPAKFAEGDAHLAAGLAKGHLTFGTRAPAATLKFLETTSLSPPLSLATAESRESSTRGLYLLVNLMRWQSARANMLAQDDPQAAQATFERTIGITEQLIAGENDPDMVFWKRFVHRMFLAQLRELYLEHPELTSAEEVARTVAALNDGRIDDKVNGLVSERLKKRRKLAHGWDAQLGGMLLPMVREMLLVTFTIAVSAWLVAGVWHRRGDNTPILGWKQSVAIWIAGICLSVVLFGLFPAEVIPPVVQTVLIVSLLASAILAIEIGIWSRWRQCLPPLIPLAGLIVTVASPILATIYWTPVREFALQALTIWPLVGLIVALLLLLLFMGATGYAVWRFVHSGEMTAFQKWRAAGIVLLIVVVNIGIMIPVAGLIEVRTWIAPSAGPVAQQMHFTPSELLGLLKIEKSKWVGAVVQWHLLHGPAAVPVIVSGLLIAGLLYRNWRASDRNIWPLLRSRKRLLLAQSSGLAAKVCLGAVLVLVCLELTILPSLIRVADADYRYRAAWLTDMSHREREIEKFQAEIRADGPLMRKLTAEVRKELRLDEN